MTHAIAQDDVVDCSAAHPEGGGWSYINLRFRAWPSSALFP